MKIAIIGGGFTGLAAAWELVKHGHQISLYESSAYPGGLAAGFTTVDWSWSLEHHYHHIFSSDHDIINLAKAAGFDHRLIFTAAKTSIIYQNQLYRFDSPLSLLNFPHLDLLSKLRTGLTLGYLKINPYWRHLESITSQQLLQSTMGTPAWKILWQPLFTGKFGPYASRINAAWFWARIHVRSPRLGYFQGGFSHFAGHLVDQLKSQGAAIHLSTSVQNLNPTPTGTQMSFSSQKSHSSQTLLFDKVLVTSSSQILSRLVKNLPDHYIRSLSRLKFLSAATLIMELDRPFFTDGTYWLNINQTDWPFLAVVEHTNFMPASHYGGKHLVYVGRYLPSSHLHYTYSQKELHKLYHPYLNILSSDYRRHLRQSWLFKADFAQPIAQTHHSKILPSIQTPHPHLYWASMQHIYPFDRGTNYAVKLGQLAARTILHDR